MILTFITINYDESSIKKVYQFVSILMMQINIYDETLFFSQLYLQSTFIL